MSDQMIQVRGPLAKGAVRNGEVAGEEYSDGEVWAEIESLKEFYHLHPEADKADKASSKL